MSLDNLRDDIATKQKKGLPFIMASVVVWIFITVIATLNIDINLKNLLVFCCSIPMLPLAWLIGKKMKVDIFSNENPLGKLGFLFTLNQFLYLLIVMWVFTAVPNKMIMVYGMVFGAHLLPYSWLYRSKSYQFFAIMIPFVTLILGNFFSGFVVAVVLTISEIVFVFSLKHEL
ncbi:hypothetical protein AB0Y06_00485 [Ligilactobacillus salivarius]|jgi:hypothetical protein|uniref:DUF7010 family protein n=1 Tax=Ligilactobacillus salivarius TaxID=1624 RepID=UPI0023681EC7|nr:hypothetical protein [Ligilactobacillus salivarius]MDW3022327.1 hypothetical protein [Ligilactobacillus salivarius]WOX36001.1 hypothetical protein R6M76_04550 [Ligilactobacillus salivarius]